MGENGQQGTKSLNERAAWANIDAFRVSVFISTPLSLLSLLNSIPSINKAVDAKVPSVAGWISATWSLPWPLFLAALFACLALGAKLGRHKTKADAANAPATASKPLPPKVPEPEEMDIADLAVLSHMAHRIQHVIADDIATAMRTPTVTVVAALQRLQRWGLVTSGVRFWSLTVQGVEYVDKHEAIFLQTKT